jgi:hypothetical protein
VVIRNDHERSSDIKEQVMSDFTQAALIGGSISGMVILTQYGRRKLELRGILRSVGLVGGFGVYYGLGAPTGRPELWAYAVALGLGLVFAAIATAFTKVERDRVSGKVMTVCGVGFVATWVVALAARLVFVWCADYDGSFRTHLGEFMLNHHLESSVIAPFFLIWALTMVIGRIAATLVRSSHLPRVAATTPAKVTV